MGLAFILAAVTLSAEPAPAAGTIPPEKRVDYVNRLADRLKGPNAWKHYRKAMDTFVPIYQLRIDEADPDRAAALDELDLNTRTLTLMPNWSTKQTKAIAGWLAANEKTLKTIKKATRYSRCQVPLEAKGRRLHDGVSTDLLVEFRPLARLTAMKANDCAQRGQWKEAYQWNARAHRMASHLHQRPFHVQHLVAAACERDAAAQFLALLSRHYPNDAPGQLEKARALDKHRCPVAVTDEVEALWARDHVESWHEWAQDPTRHPGLSEFLSSWTALSQDVPTVEALAGTPPFKDADELRAAIQASSVEHDLAVAKKLDTLYQEWIEPPFHQAWKQREAFHARYCESAKTAPSLAVYGCGDLQTHRLTMLRELTRLYRTATECVIAIHEFRDAKGHLPKSLADLVPDYAESPHIDSFSGKPMIFRVTEDGSDFTLYSVGSNQIDDGGLHGRELDDDSDFVFWPPPLRKIEALEP